MVAKLSSVKIMSAACFATSVPLFPMAIPTSAAFRDGASFTPSPVIAVIFPAFLNARTSRALWSGDTRANTRRSSSLRLSSCSVMPSKSPPDTHCGMESAIESFFAIAKAVSL